MAKRFFDPRAQIPPETQARVGVETQRLLTEMPLNELRQAGSLSQKMLSEVLQMQRPTTAKMERRTDMYISTLYSRTEAIDGHLEVIACFPGGAVKISSSVDIEETGA